jgi:hypothetical protein
MDETTKIPSRWMIELQGSPADLDELRAVFTLKIAEMG